VSKTKKITPVVLEQIPTLLEQGVPPLEIARMIGCTLGTLRVVCSKSKISLRQNNRAQNGAPESRKGSARHSVSPIRRLSADRHQSMTLELPEVTTALLQRQAGGKGLSVSTLAAKLLEMIVQDGLYEAVLDDGETSHLPPKHGTRSPEATSGVVVAIGERTRRLNKRHAA
jgi:hypothetical protein